MPARLEGGRNIRSSVGKDHGERQSWSMLVTETGLFSRLWHSFFAASEAAVAIRYHAPWTRSGGDI